MASIVSPAFAMASAPRNEPSPLSLVFVTVMVAARALCTLAMAAQSDVIRIRTIRLLFLAFSDSFLVLISGLSPVPSENFEPRYKEFSESPKRMTTDHTDVTDARAGGTTEMSCFP